MSKLVSGTIRRAVAHRAGYCCEYCLIHEDDVLFSHEIEHIISLKHGGSSELDNLAYSCIYCNRFKGSDIGTYFLPDTTFVRLFNPRTDNWEDHFKHENGQLVPLTPIGRATVKILDLNHFERIIERQILISANRYPGL